jgi:hypothetical protein
VVNITARSASLHAAAHLLHESRHQRDVRGLSLRSIRVNILTNSAMLERSSSKAVDSSEDSSAALLRPRVHRPNHANSFMGHSQLVRDDPSWEQFD